MSSLCREGRRRRRRGQQRTPPQVRALPEPRADLVAEGPQAALPLPRLHLLQVQPHRGATEGHGRTGQFFRPVFAPSPTHNLIWEDLSSILQNYLQVALKRQQAAEDAIALGIRAMATGESSLQFLPPGPIIGLSIAMQQQSSQEHSNADRRIRGALFIKSVMIFAVRHLLHGFGTEVVA